MQNVIKIRCMMRNYKLFCVELRHGECFCMVPSLPVNTKPLKQIQTGRISTTILDLLVFPTYVFRSSDLVSFLRLRTSCINVKRVVIMVIALMLLHFQGFVQGVYYYVQLQSRYDQMKFLIDTFCRNHNLTFKFITVSEFRTNLHQQNLSCI